MHRRPTIRGRTVPADPIWWDCRRSTRSHRLDPSRARRRPPRKKRRSQKNPIPDLLPPLLQSLSLRVVAVVPHEARVVQNHVVAVAGNDATDERRLRARLAVKADALALQIDRDVRR